METHQQKETHTRTTSVDNPSPHFENESRSSSNDNSSSDDDSSSDDSSSDDSSSDDQVMLKPVFVSKTKRNQKKDISFSKGDNEEDENRIRNITLAKVEHNLKIDLQDISNDVEYDGIDDTDDMNPEQEYEDWKARESNRYIRDRKVSQEQEDAKDDLIRRKYLSEEDLIKDFNSRKHERDINDAPSLSTNYHKGAFYNDDTGILEKYLKRDYSQVTDDYDKDHSRPTKFTIKKK